MKSVTFLAFSFILTFFSLIKWVSHISETGYYPESGDYTLRSNSPVGVNLVPESACDSVTLFVQQLRTFPPSCCFSLIVDNKLQNAITQIKLDITTATFTNIVVEVNQGWIVSQTPQMDILLSHNSGFIPVGGWSPLSFCLKGGNNPDSLKISYNYSALGTAGSCLVNTIVCSDPAPCDAAFSFQPIGSCGNFQFTNQSTGTAPLTYSWNFGDPTSGTNNTSTSQNPSHQFSKCGDFIVCLKTTALGCVDSICKTIAYFDQVKPVITCPANLILRCNTNTNPPATGTATATDNCTPTNAIAITFSDVVTGTMPCNGLITRTWQARDACNNISTCVQTISIQDNIPPTITCPANLVFRCNTNTNPAATGTATATDNCTPINAIAITFSDVVTGTVPCNGLITRTWQARDACNNISTCVQTISIQDNIPPTITCPANTTVNTNPGLCFYIGNIPQAIASDNCDPSLTFIYSLLTSGSSILISPQTQFPKGIHTITVFARDDCGNQSANCNFTLTVVDNSPPIIICSGNVTVSGAFDSLGNCKAVVQNIAPFATDNCPMIAVSYTLSGATTGQGIVDASGISFTAGTTVVTYIVSDMSGNKDTCSFSISVSCPDNWSCPCPNGLTGGPNLVVNGNFSVGNTGFTNDFIYIIPGGITNNGNYSVLTNTQVPLANPQWSCNDHTTGTGSFLIIDGASSTGNNAAWKQTLSGNAGGTFNFCFYANNLVIPSKNFPVPDIGIYFNGILAKPSVILPESPDAWVPFNATWSGIFPVTIEIRTLSFQVVGNDFALDDIKFTKCSDSLPCEPAFTFQSINNCGNFQFSNQSIGLPPIAYTWNFGDPGSGTSNTSTAQNPTHHFSKCGDFIVCLLMTSPGCIDSICKTISYFDSIKPVITCPANLILSCNSNISPPATGVATATDNCTPANAIIITFSDVVTGTMPCNGLITRTWQARDSCNNISTCVQTITIQDTIAPTITCPANAVVTTNQGACFYTGNLPQASGLDNCDQNLDFTYSLLTAGSSVLINPQTQFPKGVNTITCFAKDDCGNQSQNCNFTLTVVDNQPPTITCPNNMTVIGTLNAQGQCKSVINNLAPVVTDNCPMVTTTFIISGATIGAGNTDASGTSFMPGLSTVSYTATDMGGNISTCSFTITVNCPRPKCDSISASLIPTIANPPNCSFFFFVNNQASDISKIQIDLKSATFSGIGMSPPFFPTVLSPSSLAITHLSGSFQPGILFIATVGFSGGSNPDTAVVKFFYNNGLSSCDTNIIFNCPLPPPKCDSASATITIHPTICQLQLAINNNAANMTKIEVDVKSATAFSFFQILAPYHAFNLQLGTSSFVFTNNLLPIPKGNFPAANFGIIGGSNPDTVIVKFFYSTGLISCDTNIIFNCPPPPPVFKCDSATAALNSYFSTLTPCNFQLIIDNQASNMKKIEVDLKTISPLQTFAVLVPYDISQLQLGATSFTLHNNVLPIPKGKFPAVQFAVNGGSNPDTAIVKFFYNNGTISCDTNIIFNCPVLPPKPKCDSVSASLTPRVFPASPFACLFDLNISNQASSISQIRITLKTAAFGGAAISSPFIGNFFPPNLLILSHASGSIPIGNFLAAGITINGGTNPDTAFVQFFYNNGQSSCDTNIVFNCPVPPPPKPKCDSVSAFLIPFQAIPYACTYQFHINNQASAISKIQIDLKTATFNSAGIVSPFSPVISPSSRLTITHPSGFIPIGNFHTADLGINIGSNPDTAIVKFFYNNGLSTCDTNIIFNCPVDTTCGYAPSCATTSISLNTGIGANGQLLAPGSFDPNWTIIQTPYTGLILPRPAEVVTPYISWDMQPNAAAPCAQWISAFQGADKGSGPRYTYSKCFCVCTDSSNIQIKLSAMADNEADFWLYDASGNIIATLLGIHPPGNTPSHAFILPPDTSTTQLVLKKGTYCIRAGVKNWTRVTGINVCGSITGPGLIKADCCETNSYITGIKYEDTLCTGLPYTGQPKLSGWQIILCDATGNAIDTVTTDASGYYSFGPLKPGNYSVKEINKPGWTLSNPFNNMAPIALDTHEVQQANFGNCPPPLCDSISFWVETLRTVPPACCFQLHIDNKAKNKFTQIPINLFTASFNSINVDNLNGWFTSQTGLSNIGLTHASGFIPVGIFTPLSWCINNGSNPDTVKIKAEYLVGTSTTSCDTSFVFFCPPQPDTTCGIACKADSISLNTGLDHSTGQFYSPGSPDAFWTVVKSPYPSYILPKPAYVLPTTSSWHDQPNSTQPCAKWINFSGGPYNYAQGTYEFTRCFCICTDSAAIQINLSVLVDNVVDFTLCDSNGTTITQLLLINSSNFLNPPKTATKQLILDKGRYCIKASVYNYSHSYTGLNVCGSIKGIGLTKDICCEPSSITGIKYIDTVCTGAPYTGSLQTLQGWQIVLCNQQGVAIDTVTTDQNGAYSFSPLIPGLYTVKELNQPGWTPSVPSAGMSSFYLDANQVAEVNFANCPPEIDSCCKDELTFIQHIQNAIQLSVIDSLCKAKIITPLLPSCDSIYLINWGDGTIDNGPFSNGMWMHTYTQSGVYTIQVPIVEYDPQGTPCFDTIFKFTIEINCKCECGKYAINMVQNGINTPIRCNDSLILGCPAPQVLSFNGLFSCAGWDSCLTPAVQWTFTGPAVNLNGGVFAGNIQINIPAPLSPGYYTLNLQTNCGQQKCSCKITLYQRPCMITDSCNTYCTGTSWNQLNTSWIQDMVVYQGRLIVAGQFSTIGNPAVAANNIAAWNGTNWAPLAGGGLNNRVNDIEVHNGLLYAGGGFTMAGVVPVDKIAVWNGTNWSNIFQGGINGPLSNVDALLSTSSGLVVGGSFNSVGNPSINANNIARWNPSGWSLFGGLNGPVFTLAMHNNNIIAGGRFGNSPGGLNNVGVWNNSFWDKLGSGGAVNITLIPANTGDGVHAIESFGNNLIIAGQFNNAIPAVPNTKNIAKWDGVSWSGLGTGVNTGVGIYDLHKVNNEILAGGKFSQIGSQNIDLLAKWNGNAWSGLGHPSIGIVRAIIQYSPNQDSICNLYTGGEVLFNQWKCSGVAIRDQPQTLSITIYPNPTTGNLNIQFNEIIREEIEFGIYSLLGQKMFHQVIPKSNSTRPTHSIQVNELSMGTYIIKVSTLKGLVVKKIIKN